MELIKVSSFPPRRGKADKGHNAEEKDKDDQGRLVQCMVDSLVF